MPSVLAVLAHPDDECFCCGGTLARHVDEGDAVHVMSFTDGVGSRVVSGDATVRGREQRRACKALGVTLLDPLAYPDQQLDLVPLPELSDHVRLAITETEARTVYTHWRGDLNADHRRIAEAVLLATRRPGASSVRRVLAGEVPETTAEAHGEPFAPTVFVALDVAALERKVEGVKAYASEARAWPHPRSPQAVLGRAAHWGGLAGVEAAEAFCLLREVV